MLINNSTIISKTNVYLSPQIIEHKKGSTYDIENPGPWLNDKYTQMQRLSTEVKGTAQLVPQAVSHIF